MRNGNMDNLAWQLKQQPFDYRIIDEIRSFKFEDLSDPFLKENWNEFAKRFSKMKLTPQILFIKLKYIMSATLGDLSRKNEAQRKRIENQDEQLEKLRIEQQNLKSIYNHNKQQENKVKAKMQRMKQQVEDEQYLINSKDSSQTPNYD